MDFKNKGVALGSLLIQRGLITQDDLDQALGLQNKEGLRLGEALTKIGAVTIDDIGWALADQYDVPYVHVDLAMLDREAVKLIPEDFARRHAVIPMLKCGDQLSIVIDDPLKTTVLEDIRQITGLTLNVGLSLNQEIQDALNNIYGEPGAAMSLEMPEFFLSHVSLESLETIGKDSSGKEFLEALLSEAIQEHANIIHLEPLTDGIQVRHRIYGGLYPKAKASLGWHAVLLSRLKMLVGLPVNEYDTPVSGELHLTVGHKTVNMQLLICPTVRGEAATIRIRDCDCTKTLNITDLGFDSSQLTVLKTILAHQYGLVVVTGSSEEEKATTLYTLLNEINPALLKIVTVENRLNCIQDRYTQLVETRSEKMSNLLDVALFMEPDVLMVSGAIDTHLFNRLLEAVLAGHFVMVSMSMETAVEFVEYLLTLDLSHDIMATKLTVVGQWTVKALCPHCKEEYVVDDPRATALDIAPGTRLYRGKGCGKCAGTGFLGQRRLFEMIVVTDGLKEAIRRRQGMDDVKAQLAKYGYKSLKLKGIELLKDGVTSLDDVLALP